MTSTVAQIQSTVITKSDLPALKTQLSTIFSDLAYLKAHPLDEFSSEVDAAQQAAAPLKANLQAAQANPSSSAYKAVLASATNFKVAVQELTNAANTTC